MNFISDMKVCKNKRVSEVVVYEFTIVDFFQQDSKHDISSYIIWKESYVMSVNSFTNKKFIVKMK